MRPTGCRGSSVRFLSGAAVGPGAQLGRADRAGALGGGKFGGMGDSSMDGPKELPFSQVLGVFHLLPYVLALILVLFVFVCFGLFFS